MVGRRSDGYHLLSMLNTCLTFSDELQLELNRSQRIELEIKSPVLQFNSQSLGPLEQNLVYKAAQLFRSRLASEFGCKITLIKNIPAGSGLGGGSSDAAAALIGLSVLCGLSAGNELDSANMQLLKGLALQLGADVPYFLHGGLCCVEGVGEKISELELPEFENIPCILIIPPVLSSTPEVYSLLRSSKPLLQNQPDQVLEHFRRSAKSAQHPSYAQLVTLIENDLAAAAFELQPELARLHQKLSTLQNYVCGMSGSGAALFVLANSRRQLDETDLKIIDDLLGKGQNQVILSAFLPKNLTRVECVAKGVIGCWPVAKR